MKRRRVNGFTILALGLALSCGIGREVSQAPADEIRSVESRSEVSFEDQTMTS